MITAIVVIVSSIPTEMEINPDHNSFNHMLPGKKLNKKIEKYLSCEEKKSADHVLTSYADKSLSVEQEVLFLMNEVKDFIYKRKGELV